MKGLIFGNSHVGAIREGWALDKQKEMDFFAIPGGGGPNVRTEAGRLFPARKDARVISSIFEVESEGLDLAPYDYVAFCSFGFGAARPSNHWHILRVLSLARMAKAEQDGTTAVSEAFFKKAMAMTFSNQQGFKALRQIARLFRGPVICVPAPLPIAAELEPDNLLRTIYQDDLLKFLSWCGGVQMAQLQEILQDVDGDIRLLEFPEMSWLTSGTTPSDYISDTKDPWHVNGRYGRLVLKQIQRSLAGGAE